MTAPTPAPSFLQNTYGAGTGTLILTSTNGPLTIKDASSPLGTTLLGVQKNDGTVKYLDITVNGIGTDGGMSFLTRLAAAPGPTGKDRLWIKSSNGHLYHTDTSDVDTDLQAGGGGGSGITATVYQNDNVGNGTTASTSSSTFSQIGNGTTTGFADRTFTAPTATVYAIQATISELYCTTKASVVELRITVDGVEVGRAKHYVPLTANAGPSYSVFGSTSMTAASHTLRVEWRIVDSGGGTVNSDGNYPPWNTPLS